MMARKQISLFEGERMTLQNSIELSMMSLEEYGRNHRHWVFSYSGGKDSTTALTLALWGISTGRIPRPKTLTALYADTRLELLPLHYAAMQILSTVREMGVEVRVVLPELDRRFFVYMFGRGVPPPVPNFRWCTGQLKIAPMMKAVQELRGQTGEKFLMITGVRLGESAARDQRIALSCSKDGAECGQGWYHQTTPSSLADTLAPIVHWRVCHVWDWLMFEAPQLGFPTNTIAEVYGGEEAEEINARTGCVACNVASRETALDTVLKLPQWSYLQPLKRLKPLYAELRKAHNRLRKDGTERYADGSLVKNPMRLGPMTMEARRYGLGEVMAIQSEISRVAAETGRPAIDLINSDEHARILELIEANTWPEKWVGNEETGDTMHDLVIGEGIIQPLLWQEESYGSTDA